ncbi:ScbR family autoregulator-binding transcription factor [Streptomyces sp. NPDC127039]|uniref:ScbR family autoregulator-binding transcription factor n=1 Tax=Streptomyces sp. NPDC127039 TaxID=3347115 RepID=UPI00365EC3A4
MIKQERAVHTRRHLIRAAADAFERHGYAQATLSAISRQAGVSTGALHFHFANKAQLAKAVESAAAESLGQMVREADEHAEYALQALIRASHELLGMLAADTVFRAGFQLNFDRAWRVTADLGRQWQASVGRFVDDAVRAGDVRDGVQADTVAAIVASQTLGLGLLGLRDVWWCSPHHLDDFWALVLPRVAAPHRMADPSAGHTPAVARDGP